LEIPAGARDYTVDDSYVLPVDVQLLAVLPHAHYLCKEMRGWAMAPDGTTNRLLHIPQWDFNWQGDYRFARPVFLKRGTTLAMRYTYDNSTNNIRNPSIPPKPVTYGLQSSDEMAELWFQVLALDAADLAQLESDYENKLARAFLDHDEFLLRKDPNDPDAHEDIGMALMGQGRWSEAEQHFRKAIQVRPGFAKAHYDLGIVLRRLNRLAEARTALESALRLNPDDFKAHGNLGFIALQEGNPTAARAHFETALRLNPGDAMARAGLGDVTNALRGK
jgi:tetratricopeptide (TPR) repeat protein